MGNPLVPNSGNDNVYTPLQTAIEAISLLPVRGRVLDPSCGEGVFGEAIRQVHQSVELTEYDIKDGLDFMNERFYYNWVITNPPWSKFKEFLTKAMQCADNVAFLVTITHFVTKARLKLLRDHGFYLKQVHCIDTPPKPWPQSGFQVAMVWCTKEPLKEVKWIY